jgi:hypothetical protein
LLCGEHHPRAARPRCRAIGPIPINSPERLPVPYALSLRGAGLRLEQTGAGKPPQLATGA